MLSEEITRLLEVVTKVYSDLAESKYKAAMLQKELNDKHKTTNTSAGDSGNSSQS